MSDSTLLQLSPQHSVRGSTLFWIGVSAVATTLGLTMYLEPKLYEKKGVSGGTCPAGAKCCASCGVDGKKVTAAFVVIALIIGAGMGYLLHSTSKSNGGSGLSPALMQALAAQSS